MTGDRRAIVVLAVIVVLAGLVLLVGIVVSAEFDRATDGDVGDCATYRAAYGAA